MSTFLQLAQSVRSEAGLSGTGPSAVTGQSGMDKKVVDWVNDAWYDIQAARPNWRWMWRNDGAIATVAGTKSYDLAALGFDVENVIPESVSITNVGNPASIIQLEFVEFDAYREATKFILDEPDKPTLCTIDPSGAFVMNPTPDDVYDVAFEYYTPPSFLSGNTDVPELPVKFHRMIVELALTKYSSHDDAVGVYQTANIEYKKWMRRLEQAQLLEVVSVGAMA
jgi:hypothetical protein